TTSKILRNSATYTHGAGYSDPERRRNMNVKHLEMEMYLLEWFLESEERVNISNELIKDKDVELLGVKDLSFKFSNG
ncbi:hypothetical protein BGZ51_007041, partial [Haplosporangium sp. Z 767]